MYQQIREKINEQCPWLDGRPPELAELLYAIRPGYFVAAHGGICEYGVGGELSSVAYYDLTKSLRENIESNEGLARFLLEVLV